MAATIEKLKARKLSVNKKRNPSRKPKSKVGGKAAKKGGTKAQPQKPVEAVGVEEECENGAELLQTAANQAAARKSVEIADQLAEKAAHGDTASARMLVDLMVGKNFPKKKKTRAGQTYAQMLALEPPWVGPPEGEDEEGAGNRE